MIYDVIVQHGLIYCIRLNQKMIMCISANESSLVNILHQLSEMPWERMADINYQLQSLSSKYLIQKLKFLDPVPKSVRSL